MSTPDIRVRMSPEGIKELIFALRQLQAESGKASRSAASGLSIVNQQLRGLKALLPTIGLGAAVAGFVAVTRQALVTADATGKLQERVGGTVEEISGLTFAFRTNESNQEGLQKALLTTAKVMGQVRSDSGGATAAIRALGIDTAKFTQLSTPRAFEEIARKVAALPPGFQRASAAGKVFERQTGEILNALVAVGRQGIDPFVEKARRFGVLVDENMAAAAARARNALELLQIQAEGVGLRFQAGFAPQAAAAMEAFSRAVESDGVSAITKFGEVVGFTLRFIVFLINGIGAVWGAMIAQVQAALVATGEAVKEAFSGNFGAAADAIKRGIREINNIDKSLTEDLDRLRDELTAPPEIPERTDGGEGDLDDQTERLRREAQARLALQRQALDNELRLQQEMNRAKEEADKAALDQGLISLEEFFRRRREIIIRNSDAEVAALRAQRAAIAASATGPGAPQDETERIKLRQQLAQIDAQIQIAELQRKREIAALDAEAVAAQKDLTNEQAALSAKLAELEGDRHAAFLANLQIEIEAIRALGARAGQTAEQISARVEQLVSARTAAFDFEEIARRADSALAAFDRDAAAIRRDQEAGIIAQIEGEQRLIEMQRARLAVLQEMARAIQEAALKTGDDEQIEKAKQFADSVNQIAVSFRQATDFASQFRSGAFDAVQSGLTEFLANADEIENLGDAFKSLARSIVQSLNQIAAEIIAKQATFALIRFFGAAFGGAGAAPAGGRLGGLIRGYAGGGAIRGPKLAIRGPDNIPFLGQEGEFVMRRARVAEPGALSFLRAWNEGRVSLAQALRLPRFAEGGEVGQLAQLAASRAVGRGRGEGGGRDPEAFRIINLLDPQLINDALASSSGERSMLNVITKNRTAIRRSLGL